MYFVQIFLVFFCVFVYVTQEVGIQGKVYETDGETKRTENIKSDVAPRTNSTNKNQSFIVDLSKSHNNKKQNIETDAVVLNKANKSIPLNNSVSSNKTANLSPNSLPKINQTLEEKTGDLEASGAVTRGILVFLVLGFLFILYVGIKTYRRKNQDKRRTIVTKYGVRTRRNDVEMEPLPLSDDDEDETVFELTTTKRNGT